VAEGSQDDAAPGSQAAYRGFLFADLRGYTAFVQRHGDRAGADLLDAYRALVRDEVARHAGAEIRTEGDSFYVVFASAREAVACGLAIVDVADRYSRDHPDRPIRVGIGINAGETVQRGEGFVGSAVNLAARLCSQARTGEVLVSGPVREAARDPDLQFVSRGNRRLKGIADPVPAFAVAPAALGRRTIGLSRPARRIGVPWLAAVLGGAAVIAALLLAGRWLPSADPGSNGSTLGSSAPTAVVGSPSPTPSGQFPDEYESFLLSSIDPELAEDCELADPEDVPRLGVDRELAGLPGTGYARVPIPVRGGVACSVLSAFAPSELHYWYTAPFLDFQGAGDLSEAVVLSDVGRLAIPLGDCTRESPAYGHWEFGDSAGWIQCRESDGDALILWNYDDQPIVGVAQRNDGDMGKLIEWWLDHARFRGP